MYRFKFLGGDVLQKNLQTTREWDYVTPRLCLHLDPCAAGAGPVIRWLQIHGSLNSVLNLMQLFCRRLTIVHESPTWIIVGRWPLVFPCRARIAPWQGGSARVPARHQGQDEWWVLHDFPKGDSIDDDIDTLTMAMTQWRWHNDNDTVTMTTIDDD